MKIIIFGSNGMLGKYVSNYLKNLEYNIIPLTRIDYDLNNFNIISLNILLNKLKINESDIIINCAGVIPQSSNRNNITDDSYYKINSIFPIILNILCNEIKCKLIHITTDCVFDGKKGNYNELSYKTEKNIYGISKSLGELCDSTIIRTSIIGEEKYNKTSLLEWVRNNKDREINGYINHFWNGITCLQLAKIIENIITNNLFWKGVRHVFSPEIVSKYDLIKIINDVYQLNIKINKTETEKIDKSLCSIYENNFKIPTLVIQIQKQKEFIL